MSTNSKIKINLDSLKTRREWKRHKVKDGSNVFRILPPFGENSNGYPYRKWQIIWGLQDPESGRARPFASSMTSEKKCPVTEYVQSLKKKAESLKGQLAAAGLTEEEQKERLGALNKLISDLTPKTVYIYNAADKAGEVGLLELKSTAHKKMKAEMAQYIQDYNQDPTSLNSEETDSGVWFNILRSGLGRDTEYDVKKMQNKIKKPTGGFNFEDDRSPLPDAVVENYDNLAYDLSSVYQVKTYDELSEILAANMESLIELCPDADVDAATAVEQQILRAPAAKPAAATKLAGTKPVTLKVEDGDDEEEAPAAKTTSRPAATTKVNVAADDDFLAEADALLNS
jgi:hypothetical protein